MSRREASRLPVRAVYRAIMAPEFGADMVPLAPAPVPGKPGAAVSLKASLMQHGGAQPITLRRLMVVQYRHQFVRPTESDPWTEMDLRDLMASLRCGDTIEDAAQHLCRSGTIDDVRRKAVNLLALEPIL